MTSTHSKGYFKKAKKVVYGAFAAVLFFCLAQQAFGLEPDADRTAFLAAGSKTSHAVLAETADARTFSVLGEKIRSIKNSFQAVWDFELWSINEHAVNIRKVFVALIILFLGMFLAKLFIRYGSKRLLLRAHLDKNAVALINKILYYFAVLVIILFALRIVNIPLTAFTFLGGAVAIGIGFGAQNLINNFISGFIIMVERPIKIGDMIEMENDFGTIEEIGARCTRIRTAGNIHILVPNSSFLEKNITNWTLSDQNVRTQVSVGVAYGSDTQRVFQLMLQAVKDNPKVLKTPEAIVIFKDFGDSALIFEIFFWLKMTRLMDPRMVQSEIRFQIDKLFREAGIVIAFPQRDTHLDTQKPLDVRIIQSKTVQASE